MVGNMKPLRLLIKIAPDVMEQRDIHRAVAFYARQVSCLVRNEPVFWCGWVLN